MIYLMYGSICAKPLLVVVSGNHWSKWWHGSTDTQIQVNNKRWYRLQYYQLPWYPVTWSYSSRDADYNIMDYHITDYNITDYNITDYSVTSYHGLQ